MPKPIGPTFADELRAAGCAELPFSWSGDGTISFDPAITTQQHDAVIGVYAVHDPASRPPLPDDRAQHRDELAAPLERARTRAVVDFLNVLRKGAGLDDLSEDEFTARMVFHLNRL